MLIEMTSLPAADFHVFAAATGKARSPIFRTRVGGMTNAKVDDEHRLRPGIQRPAVGRQPTKSARVNGGTGTLARLACRQFVPACITNAGDKAAE